MRRLGFRMTALRAGAVAGTLLTVVPVLVVQVVLGAELYHPAFNVEVVAKGADVSRSGGRTVLVRNERGVVLRQECREDCDDVRLQASTSDNAVSVEVLDAQGRALTERVPMTYVTGGYGASITRFTVVEDGGLRVRISSIDRTKDGTFVEKPW